MTAKETPHGEPHTTPRAMYFDGLSRILRTAGIEPAVVTKPRAKQVTVAVDYGNQDFLHCFSTFSQNCSSDVRKIVASAPPAFGLAFTTISSPLSFSW